MPRRKPKTRGTRDDDSLSFSVLPRAAHDPERSKTDGSEFVLVPSNQAAENAVLSGMLDDHAGHQDTAVGAVRRRDAGGVRAVDEMGFPIDGYDYQQHLATTGGGRFIMPDGTVIEPKEHGDAAAAAATSSGLLPGGGAAAAEGSRLTPYAEDAIHMPGEGMKAHHLLEGVTLGGDALPDDLREAMEAAEAEAATDDEGDDAGGELWGGRTGDDAANPVPVDGFEELNDDFVVMAAGVAPVGAGWEEQVEVTEDGRLADAGRGTGADFDFVAHLKKLMAAAGDDEDDGGFDDEDEEEEGEDEDEDEDEYEEEMSLEEYERMMALEAQQRAGAEREAQQQQDSAKAAASLAAAVEATGGDGDALTRLGHSLDDGMDLVLAQFGEDAIGDPGEEAEAEAELRLLRAAAGDDKDRLRRLAILAGEDVSDDEDDQAGSGGAGGEEADAVGPLSGGGVRFAARSVRSGRSGARSSRRGGSAAGGMSVAESMSLVAMRAAEVLAERVESSKLDVRMPSLNAMAEEQELKEHAEAKARAAAEAAEAAEAKSRRGRAAGGGEFAAGLAGADATGPGGGEHESKMPEDEGDEDAVLAQSLAATAGRQQGLPSRGGFGADGSGEDGEGDEEDEEDEEDEDEEGLLEVEDLPALRTTVLPDGSLLRMPVAEVYSSARKRLAEGRTVSREGALKVKDATLRLHAAMAERDAAEDAAIELARERRDAARAKAEEEAGVRASESKMAFTVTLPNTSFGGVGADAEVPSAGDRAVAQHFSGYLASKRATDDCATVLTGLSTTSNLPTVVDDEPNTRRQARRVRQLRGQQQAAEDRALRAGLELVPEDDGREEAEHEEPPSGRIVLSSRIGIPIPASRGMAAAQTGLEAEAASASAQTEEEAEEEEAEESVVAPRRRGESKEEKQARKQAAKELRRRRLEERRGLRDAFKQEGKRQEAAAAGGRAGGRLGKELGTGGNVMML